MEKSRKIPAQNKQTKDNSEENKQSIHTRKKTHTQSLYRVVLCEDASRLRFR
jgi:hypothetical protein